MIAATALQRIVCCIFKAPTYSNVNVIRRAMERERINLPAKLRRVGKSEKVVITIKTDIMDRTVPTVDMIPRASRLSSANTYSLDNTQQSRPAVFGTD